jgi:hypothetical protein
MGRKPFWTRSGFAVRFRIDATRAGLSLSFYVLWFMEFASAVRIFKTRWFGRYARRERIDDESLTEAIARAERGLADADLGGGIIKQRVARSGQGRSGGHRMPAAYRAGDRAVFLYGFAKSERENIGPDELLTLRDIGAAWLAADAGRIAQALNEDALPEVTHDGQFP